MQKIEIRRSSARRITPAGDPRWEALNAVREARSILGIKDRTITVLRGLLTLVPVETWVHAPFAHASNAVLQERCDGMDERTLRRHLSKLVEVGLIARRQSPNRKRYVVRDEDGAVLLAYGFDIGLLRDALPRLRMLSEQHRSEQAKITALKAVLRDRLYHVAHQQLDIGSPNVQDYHKLLRRDVAAETIESAISALNTHLQLANDNMSSDDTLTDSDGQNDRHIQSSNEESTESERSLSPPPGTVDQITPSISIDECRQRASEAMAFTEQEPKSWGEMDILAQQLGPSLGLSPSVLAEARLLLGRQGYTLAVLGLTQAFPHIRKPGGYLRALLKKAKVGSLNVSRMFWSLTSARRDKGFPAGNYA